MKNSRNKKAFTLIEVLIAVAVLSIVLLAATSSLVTIIRTNADNRNTIIAYGLAQEGVEAIRNIRDSDWLLGSDFRKKGVIGSNNIIWGATLPAEKETKYYSVDYNINVVKQNNNMTMLNSTAAPWKLSSLPCDDSDQCATLNETLLYTPKKQITNSREDGLLPTFENFSQSENLKVHAQKQFDLLNGKSVDNYYTHSSSSDKQQSLFHRFIKIQEIPHKIGTATKELDVIKKYLVESSVYWQDEGVVRKVVLSTEITDWKQL